MGRKGPFSPRPQGEGPGVRASSPLHRQTVSNCSQGTPNVARKPSQKAKSQPLPARLQTVDCELCQREVDRYTVHHLVPRARGGRFGPTANLCPTCHRQLHALFTEATLADELNSIALLRSNPRVNSYLRWVRKQKSAAGFKVRRANDRK